MGEFLTTSSLSPVEFEDAMQALTFRQGAQYKSIYDEHEHVYSKVLEAKRAVGHVPDRAECDAACRAAQEARAYVVDRLAELVGQIHDPTGRGQLELALEQVRGVDYAHEYERREQVAADSGKNLADFRDQLRRSTLSIGRLRPKVVDLSKADYPDFRRIMLLGTPKAGVTSLISHICDDDPAQEKPATPYFVFSMKEEKILGNLAMHVLWDLPSAEERWEDNRALAGYQIVIGLCLDLSQPSDTWAALERQYRSFTEWGTCHALCIIGTKADLPESKDPRHMREAEEWAARFEAPFVRVSIRDPESVKRCLVSLSLVWLTARRQDTWRME